MNDATRRGFLAMAGVGAAAVGAAAALPAGLDVKAPAAEAHPEASSGNGPLVAVVADSGQGEVSLLFGDTEVVINDRALVNRLVALSRKGV